jgi:hypothetical protein
MEQAARNFIQQHHTAPFMDTTEFSQEAIQCLKRSGCTVDFFSTFTIHHVSYLPESMLTGTYEGQDEVLAFIRSNLLLPDDIGQKEISQLVRYNVTLSATVNSNECKTNNRYIRVNEQHFGEIASIIELPSEEKYLIALRKFQKKIVLNDSGAPILLPRNHYPFQRTNDFFVFELTRSVFIQKGFYCLLSYKNQAAMYPCLSFRPNDWFSF